jgi:hypothetical protein
MSMRGRLLVIAVATTLLMAGLPAATLAAPPSRLADTQTTLDCELSDTSGTTFVSIGISAEFGEFGGLAHWAPGAAPFEDLPIWVSDGVAISLSPDGSHLIATFDLFEVVPGEEPELGDPVGSAVLDATLSPSGPAEDITERFRDGNRQIRISGTNQPLSVSGSLELPEGIAYADLSGCIASHSTYSIFETNPNTFVFNADQITLACFWMDEESAVDLFGVTEDFGSFADIFVSDASGSYSGFAEDVTLTPQAFSASFQLISEATGEVEGSATASATLTVGDRVNFMDRFDSSKFKVVGRELLVDGTLTLETPAGERTLSMDDEACSGLDARVQDIFTNPNPGKGPRLANDAPDGAVPLQLGDEVQVRTGGTAELAEEPCIGTDPEYGEFDVPIGHTVWYAVEGTGGTVAVDTAGSSYDTVIGVYTSDGAALTSVTCVDDVFEEPDFFSLQARVTLETTAGVTYYIQVGGYGGASGTLQVAVY